MRECQPFNMRFLSISQRSGETMKNYSQQDKKVEQILHYPKHKIVNSNCYSLPLYFYGASRTMVSGQTATKRFPAFLRALQRAKIPTIGDVVVFYTVNFLDPDHTGIVLQDKKLLQQRSWGWPHRNR